MAWLACFAPLWLTCPPFACLLPCLLQNPLSHLQFRFPDCADEFLLKVSTATHGLLPPLSSPLPPPHGFRALGSLCTRPSAATCAGAPSGVSPPPCCSSVAGPRPRSQLPQTCHRAGLRDTDWPGRAVSARRSGTDRGLGGGGGSRGGALIAEALATVVICRSSATGAIVSNPTWLVAIRREG